MTRITNSPASPRRPAVGAGKARRHGRYHHGDLRRSLVAAGRALLERQGAAQLSLRQVAQAAGVSPAAPYAHFADRTALLAAIAETGFADFRAALWRAGGRSGMSAAERLQAMAVAYVLFAHDHPALFRLMFGPELADLTPHPTLREAATASFAVLQQAVGSGKAQRRPHQEAAVAAWALVHGLAVLILDGRVGAGLSRQALIRRIKVATGHFRLLR